MPIATPEPAATSDRAPVKVDFALQGGGAHGAFTWGVLDRLLEERSLSFESISGTSAGAINAVLLASGYAMFFLRFGGFKGAGLHIHVMQATGIVMMLLFLHLFFAPWRRFSRAVEAGEFDSAAVSLNQIRRIVAINLVLGVITIAAGASGRFWA